MAGSRTSRSSGSPRAKAKGALPSQCSTEEEPSGIEVSRVQVGAEVRCKAKVVPPEVFARLYTPQRPEVALQTNCQLLAWLSKRSKDPEIASTRPSTMASTMASNVISPFALTPGVSCELASSWASPPSSRSGSRRHESPGALFDHCLRKAPGACPTTPRPKPRPGSICSFSASAYPEHSGHNLAESLQSIDVLAEDPVDCFIRSEQRRAHSSMERQRFDDSLEHAQTPAERTRQLLCSAAARAHNSRAHSALG